MQKQDRLVQIRYVIVNKERYIKRLETENKLMKDFLLYYRKKVRTSILRYENEYGINETCKFLQVPCSGHYAFLKRLEIPDRDLESADKIRKCQGRSRNTYGYRRVRI